MTPEQREEVIAHHEKYLAGLRRMLAGWLDPEDRERWQYLAEVHETALALLTPEAEADRRLGAKVREALDAASPADACAYHAALIEKRGTSTFAPPVLRAIAAALREEAGR